MSQRWRTRQRQPTEQEQGNDQAWSNELDMLYQSNDYPVSKEIRFVDAANHIVDHPGVGDIEDAIDWEVGGLPGATKNVGSMNVVESTLVDAHNYTGEQATIRRMPDTNWGDVGTADYSGVLGVLYAAQESSHYFPNEVSQADLVRSV